MANRPVSGHDRLLHLVLSDGDQNLVIGAKYCPVDPAASRREDRSADGHVPQPHRMVIASGGDDHAIRAERHRVDRERGSGEGIAICWPVATSHNCTVPSPLPVARSFPFGLNATESTEVVRPIRGPSATRRVAMSHSRTAPSP